MGPGMAETLCSCFRRLKGFTFAGVARDRNYELPSRGLVSFTVKINTVIYFLEIPTLNFRREMAKV